MVSLGAFITVNSIGYVEASSQGYSMGSFGPLITVNYIGYVEASRQGYSTGSLGAFIRSIILVK
jgi:hypothetical protein